MGTKKTLFAEKKMSEEELRIAIQKERNPDVLKKLLFMLQMYITGDIEEARQRVCISRKGAYLWLNIWNSSGYDGFLPSDAKRGKKPLLSEADRERLKEILKSKGNWLTGEVKALIRKEFGVSYSERHVSRLLRDFGMHYSKPYGSDFRRPENAAEILKERLDDALEGVKEDFIVGFIDEASPQTNDNKQRFWSFGKSRIVRNTTKFRANTFGFYSANGNGVAEFMDNSKKESVFAFLRGIREKNPKGKIIAILDNFASHVAAKRYAESLGIILVFLPPYSPDLNPIEQIWRCVRRKVSQACVKSERSFRETIRSSFHHFSGKLSFMKGWLETFMPDLCMKLCH